MSFTALSNLTRGFAAVAALLIWPPTAKSASCDPISVFASQHQLQPQSCKVVDNGAIKLRVCAGETTASLRIEAPDRPGLEPIDATEVVTWFNEVPRSEPSGSQYTFGGTIFVGPTQALSMRYKDYIRGDTAVSGANKTPDDQADVRIAPATTLNCKILPPVDAELELIVAGVHAAKR